MSTVQPLASALAGLGLGLGLIVAIGAQNAFVLRQGIRRENVLAVVLICIASDAVLIVAGVVGAGALFTAVPWLLTVARWGGALFLLGYAVLAARRAARPPTPGAALYVDRNSPDEQTRANGDGMRHQTPPRTGPSDRTEAGTTTLRLDERPAPAVDARGSNRLLPAVMGTTLALTWLNPHVYLDTVVLLGSVGSAHGQTRWAFAAGAILGSMLWFTALGVAARALAPVFARPVAWRVLDGIIAVVMTCVATGLVVGG